MPEARSPTVDAQFPCMGLEAANPEAGLFPPALLVLMKYYRTGLKIPQSGIYKVTHSRHRLPHEVTLLAGEAFPRCSRCGDNVQFQIVAPAGDLDKSEFRVVVYELPAAA